MGEYARAPTYHLGGRRRLVLKQPEQPVVDPPSSPPVAIESRLQSGERGRGGVGRRGRGEGRRRRKPGRRGGGGPPPVVVPQRVLVHDAAVDGVGVNTVVPETSKIH